MSELSLRDKLAAQRKRLEQAREVRLTIPVVGYRKLIAARYRVLTFEEKQTIVNRHQGAVDKPDETAPAAADMLINACEELMEVTGEGSYSGTGQRWTAAAIRDLFGADLPEGATARQALMSVLDSEQVLEHFGEYILTLKEMQDEVDGELLGESEPSVEGLTS